MRRFRFNKLVRDNIVSEIERGGGRAIKRELNDAEFIEQLHLKLLEEFTEYTKASKDKVVSELSDVYEVLESIRSARNISESEIKEARLKKADKSEDFKNRTFIEYVEVENDNPWVQYYLDNSDRYPEILE